MFGKIKYITEGEAHIEANILEGQDTDVMNMNVIFEAPDQRILGEVEEVNTDNYAIGGKTITQIRSESKK